jgi:hypothetical protein
VSHSVAPIARTKDREAATAERAEQLRDGARDAYLRGEFEDALRSQVALVNGSRGTGKLSAHDFRFLGLCFQALGDRRQAYVAWREALSLDPHDATTKANLAFFAAKCGRIVEALKFAEQAANERPDDANCWTILANANFYAGRFEEARRAGLRSLEIKDRSVPASHTDLSGVAIPPFDTTDKRRNVIAFSLWGNKERYLVGAQRNALAVPLIYEGWCARFYLDDSVPAAVRERLIQLGADLVPMPRAKTAFSGLFWRFLVADDPEVDRCLIRDADSIINVQERVAVDEWVASGRHFHVMRDFWTHTGLMLAGLWGGVRGALPPLGPQIAAFLASEASRDAREYPERTLDQRFLREMVWPIVRQSAHVHDSIFRYRGAVDFPTYGRRASGRHVGQNESMTKKDQRGRELAPAWNNGIKPLPDALRAG